MHLDMCLILVLDKQKDFFFASHYHLHFQLLHSFGGGDFILVYLSINIFLFFSSHFFCTSFFPAFLQGSHGLLVAQT